MGGDDSKGLVCRGPGGMRGRCERAHGSNQEQAEGGPRATALPGQPERSITVSVTPSVGWKLPEVSLPDKRALPNLSTMTRNVLECFLLVFLPSLFSFLPFLSVTSHAESRVTQTSKIVAPNRWLLPCPSHFACHPHRDCPQSWFQPPAPSTPTGCFHCLSPVHVS